MSSTWLSSVFSALWLRCAVLLLSLWSAAAVAGTAPWLSMGDRGLRSDVELLAAYGLAGDLTTTWPIPTRQLMHALSDQARLDAAPPAVQAAAQRVLAALAGSTPDDPVRPMARLQTTNQSALIRDFGSAARDEADVMVGGNLDTGPYDIGLRVGEQTHYNGSGARFSLDGSYVGARWGNLQFYGGWLDQWYGPGSTSSLLLSNNARPMPKFGVMRADTTPFETPLLSWLGPYQVNFFVGLLNGPRIDTNTGFVSLRIAFEPVQGLEIGLTRETEICGKHHRCKPTDYFNPNNSPTNTNQVNDEAGIDFKYTRLVGTVSVSPYVQIMNEDNGPFVHAYASYLAGTSLAGLWGTQGANWRLTAEYADSVSTQNWFDFGKKGYGVAYNNYQYLDGFRYRDRTLGFSLDSDSRLFSLEALFTDERGWRWRLAYRHADISTPQLAAMQAKGGTVVNVVSAQPVTLNEGEGGVDIPLGPLAIGLTVRGMDGRPYGSDAAYLSGEADLRYGF